MSETPEECTMGDEIAVVHRALDAIDRLAGVRDEQVGHCPTLPSDDPPNVERDRAREIL